MSVIQRMFAKASAVFLMAVSTAAGATAGTTLQNMQTAFNGESNAHMRYLAFAEQADRENYGEVASLFRAAARAEAVHASNHAEVLKGMGAVPQAKLESPQVKSTRENLEAAIKGETYERDIMYPTFLQQARLDGNGVAVRSLQLAQTAEAEHAKLYTRSLQDLNKLKGSKSTIFFVCPTCGYTVSEMDFANCPSCSTPREDFEKVS
ncbi:MAG TPA: rubrerythrin family protein [Acidobacteriaceae bacterium]|nr:rubrerythrin family protein [Acidobacteriaceae bacterium]